MAVPQIYGGGMWANPGDSQQIALVKTVALLYDLVVTQNSMSVPTIYAPGMYANPGDSQQICLVKIVALLYEWVVTNGGGGSGAGGVTSAAGDPATDGSITTLFYRNTSSGVVYINTGTEAVPTWYAI